MYIHTLVSLIEVLLVVIPSLLTVAFVTIAERKTMASMQRRLGPNAVGWYGLLQAFADALKLLLKEYVSPTQANLVLFFLGPVITLIFSLLGYAIVPYSPGIAILDFNLSILYALAVSSLATYGILLAGWSANSKYAFLGSLRSTAQLISYELILSSAILLVVLLAGSLSISVIVESQRYIWYIFPLFPIFIIFFIGGIAETNRAPFDLAEAESELVSGFMTEHSAVIFVFFFLAEYASIVLICILTSVLFLGGYLYTVGSSYINIYYNIINLFYLEFEQGGNIYAEGKTAENDSILEINQYMKTFSPWILNSIIEGLIHALTSGLKACIMIFLFIWVRASFPRIRYDELMLYCWTKLLPFLIAVIIIIPVLQYDLKTIPADITLLINLWFICTTGFINKVKEYINKIKNLITRFFILFKKCVLNGLSKITFGYVIVTVILLTISVTTKNILLIYFDIDINYLFKDISLTAWFFCLCQLVLAISLKAKIAHIEIKDVKKYVNLLWYGSKYNK